MTMGSTMFFLALLILCSKWHDGDTSSAVYVLWNVGMLAALALALALGWVGDLPAMRNTAAVFFVLWVIEKEAEVKWGRGAAVVLFVNFAALFCLALYLQSRPQLLLSLFDPRGVLLIHGDGP